MQIDELTKKIKEHERHGDFSDEERNGMKKRNYRKIKQNQKLPHNDVQIS